MPHQTDDSTATAGANHLSSALRCLLNHLDMPVSEAEWRSLGPMPNDPADIQSIRQIVARLGLALHDRRLIGWRLRREQTPFMLIGRKPDDIWIVRGRTSRDLVLVSAADGSVQVHGYKAVRKMIVNLIKLTPDANPEKDRSWSGVIKAQLKPVLWQVGLASIVINILALASPIFMMTVYNKVVNHGALATLDVMAIGMVSLLLFELLLRAMRGTIAARTGAKLDAALGSEVIHHLLSLPNRVFDNMPTGQMMERIRQLDQLRQFLTGQLPLLLADLLFVGLFIIAIFLLSPPIGWITLATLPAFVLVSWAAHDRQKRLTRKSFVEGAAKASALGEIVGQSFTVKALGLETEMERRFERRLVTSAYCGYRASSLGNLIGALGLGLQHAVALLLIYVGARMIIEGSLSIGALIACSILAARAIAPMRQLFAAWHQLEQTRHAYSRIRALMHEAPETVGRDLGKMSTSEIEIVGRIAFKEVTFRYRENKIEALNGLTFAIEPGTMLGVTGLPGSGKSTLMRLLIGLDKPQEGGIEIDGYELSQVNSVAYRQQIGVVPQEIQLFKGTIADNIAIASEDKSLARIIAAAKFVGAHEFIEGLPAGYDTELRERGDGLSLGQRQLITIARALVRNPRILVMDEATSALDAATESYLLENLRRAGRGRTIIMVSHKENVLKACDSVLVLDAGRLRKLDTADQCLPVLRNPAKDLALQTVNSA